MLSGIGEESQLRRHGIPLIQHLPGVGRNFQDHILVAGCVWEYRTPEEPRNNSAEFTFFCKSHPSLAAPDLQPVLEERAFGSEMTQTQYDLPADAAAAWTLAPGLVRPHSRGRVELTGNRPEDRVAVHANFLDDRRDVDALLFAVELCREIGNSAPLRKFVRRELMPGPLDAADMEQWLRRAAGTYFHQSGTAKMGARRPVRGGWVVARVRRAGAAHRRWLHHAGDHHRQYHGALRDDRRAGGRSVARRSRRPQGGEAIRTGALLIPNFRQAIGSHLIFRTFL